MAPDESVDGATDATLTAVDGSGATQSFSVAQLDDVLTVLPGKTIPLRKIVLQNLVLPVASLTSVDPHDIRELRLSPGPNATAAGIYVSDIALVTPTGVGTPAISTRPTISVIDTNIEESDSVWNAQAAIVLSKPSTRTISAAVSVLGVAASTTDDDDFFIVAPRDSTHSVTFAPGETCKAISAPIRGDNQPSTAQSSHASVFVIFPRHATAGDAVGRITVREDDGVVNSRGRAVPSLGPVGIQRAACDEANARPGVLAASPTRAAPGDTVIVTGTGFRVGESVTLAMGDTVVESDKLSNSDGFVSFRIAVPASAAVGENVFTATGTGSRYRASVALTVGAP